jgi:hypothetical protein
MADPNDPVSTATRATKRNLLVVSVLAIAANAFNISIEKIPIAGLSINFDNRLFAFLLLIALVYFLGTFILYYTIDIKNLEKTPHQEESEKAFREHLTGFEQRYAARIQADLRSLAPLNHRFHLTNFADHLRTGEFDNILTYRILGTKAPASPRQGLAEMSRNENPIVFNSIDKRLKYWIDRFPRAKAWDARRARLTIRGIRLMYLTRNYLVDGALPILLGVVALAAVLGYINLHWLQNIFRQSWPLSVSSRHFD